MVNIPLCTQYNYIHIYISDWWFGFFFLPYIGNNHPNWRIFFKMVKTVRDRFTRVILSGVLALTVLTRLRPEKPSTSPHLKLLALDTQSPPRSDKWSCAFNSLSKVLHVGFTGLPTDLWAWKKGYGEMPIDWNDNCKVMTWMLNREYATRKSHQPAIIYRLYPISPTIASYFIQRPSVNGFSFFSGWKTSKHMTGWCQSYLK